MAQNNSLFVLENFNLQSWKVKLEKWHEPSNKSAITGFHIGKNSKFSGSFSWGCFMRHRLPWFLWCCFWFPYFFDCPFCGRPCCKNSIISINCWSRWFPNTNPKKLTAFTSPTSISYFTSPTSILGSSLPNSCVTDGYWFSSIIHFAMFSKSINDCTISFRAFWLFIILENALATGCLYCLNELTAWQVCVALVSKPKQRSGKPQVTRSLLGTKFLKTISVWMKALPKKVPY